MEAAANQIKLDFVVHIVALPNRLGVDDADVVVRKSHSQDLLILVKGHSQDLLTLCSSWLPASDEIVGILARCGIVHLLSDPHGHVSIVRPDEEALGESLDADDIRIVLFRLKGVVMDSFKTKVFEVVHFACHRAAEKPIAVQPAVLCKDDLLVTPKCQMFPRLGNHLTKFVIRWV